MTCKDCVHYGVCWKQLESLNSREMEDAQECCETAKEIKAGAIKEFAELFTEKMIMLFNLEYNQAESIRRTSKEIVKNLCGEDIYESKV